MIVIVGLGNPGAKYENNRHNIGFMAVDEIVRRHNFSTSRKKFKSEIFEGTLAGEKALCVKPQTFMNESGRAVGEIVRFYNLEPADVFVFHDELDLPAAKLRMKLGGGIAGHNGLRSIKAHIGADFYRGRMGIGHPGDKAKVHSYVLKDFARVDRDWIDPLLEAIAEASPLLANGEVSSFQNKVHVILQPEKKQNDKKPADKAKSTATKQPAKKAEPASGAFSALKGLLGGNQDKN